MCCTLFWRPLFARSAKVGWQNDFQSLVWSYGSQIVTVALRHLLPSMSLGPRAFAMNLLRLILACLVVVYLALMPVAFLPTMGWHTYTSLYVHVAGLSLAPMLAIAVSTGLLYGYAYALTVPVVRSMGQGRTVVHQAIGGAASRFLHLLIRLAHAWALILGVTGREPVSYLSISPLRFPRLGTPAHLATGWHPGTNPQVLYS